MDAPLEMLMAPKPVCTCSVRLGNAGPIQEAEMPITRKIAK